LDILDGSPPCSSFSMSGSREKKWGIEKKFREGQAVQVLDDLFFDYLEIVKKLKPKVVVAENVKGLIIGNARYYVKQIFEKFQEAGYTVQLFLLNAATMGVPQARERTFFIAHRNDLQLPKIKLEFNEKPIYCQEAFAGITDTTESLTPDQEKWWKLTLPGESFSKHHPKGSLFGSTKVHPKRCAPTLLTSDVLVVYITGSMLES
jgi:DNA (cytosine-5)-methyltransferase 1